MARKSTLKNTTTAIPAVKAGEVLSAATPAVYTPGAFIGAAALGAARKPVKPEALRQNVIAPVAIGDINVETGYNVRTFDPSNERDRALMDQIDANGQSTPITVRIDRIDGKLYIVAGHRRYFAITALNAEHRATLDAKDKNYNDLHIPVMLCTLADPRLSSSAGNRNLDLLSSNDGVELTQLQKAIVFLRLREYRWTDADIAKRAGMTVRGMQEILRAADLPDEMKADVIAGYASASLAVDAVKAAGDDAPRVMKRAQAVAKKAGRTKITEGDVAEAATALKVTLRGMGKLAKKQKNKAGAAGAEAGKAEAGKPATAEGGKPANTQDTMGDETARVVGPFHCGPKVMKNIYDSRDHIVAEVVSATIAARIVAAMNAAHETQGTEVASVATPAAAAAASNKSIVRKGKPMHK